MNLLVTDNTMANEVAMDGAVGIQFAARSSQLDLRKRYCERRKNTTLADLLTKNLEATTFTKYVLVFVGEGEYYYEGKKSVAILLKATRTRRRRRICLILGSDNFEPNEGPEGDCIVTATPTPCRGC